MAFIRKPIGILRMREILMLQMSVVALCHSRLLKYLDLGDCGMTQTEITQRKR